MTLTVSNNQERKRLAARARSALNRAKELGDNSELASPALSGMQGGASLPNRFSLNPEADLSMQQAEVDFVMGELAQAIDLYKKGLEPGAQAILRRPVRPYRLLQNNPLPLNEALGGGL